MNSFHITKSTEILGTRGVGKKKKKITRYKANNVHNLVIINIQGIKNKTNNTNQER